jgi:hypothetical protein
MRKPCIKSVAALQALRAHLGQAGYLKKAGNFYLYYPPDSPIILLIKNACHDGRFKHLFTDQPS